MMPANVSKDEIAIRRASESDLPVLTRLLAEPGFDHATEALVVNARFDDLIRDGDLILVAAIEMAVVGMATLHRTRYLHRPPDGRIVSLVVSEDYRGHRVGARLVDAAELVFREWGCSRVEVTSGAAREAAHRFYIRCGYAEQRKRFVKVLNEGK